MGAVAIDGEIDKSQEAISFFTGVFRRSIESVPENIMLMNEEELSREIHPTKQDWLLRHRIWQMVSDTKRLNLSQIKVTELIDGACDSGYFYRNWMHNHYRIAWAFKPIGEKSLQSREAFYHLMNNIRDFIITTPVHDENLGDMIKLAKFLSDQAFGPQVHKIQTQNFNANLDLNNTVPVSDDEIKKQISTLETVVETPIDVSAIDVSEDQ